MLAEMSCELVSATGVIVKQTGSCPPIDWLQKLNCQVGLRLAGWMILVFVSEMLNFPKLSNALMMMGVGTGLVLPTSHCTLDGTSCAFPEPLEYGAPFGARTVPVIVTVCLSAVPVRISSAAIHFHIRVPSSSAKMSARQSGAALECHPS